MGPEMRRIAGADYLVDSTCKPHDCGNNYVVAIYDYSRNEVFAILKSMGRRPVLIGNPPPAVASGLWRLRSDFWPGDPTSYPDQ